VDSDLTCRALSSSCCGGQPFSVSSSSPTLRLLSVLGASQQAPGEHYAAPALDTAGTRGTRVLLVQDNEINQEVAIGQLEDAEIDVDLAENGEIAVRMVQEKEYDLVLMDMQMPVMDGIEARGPSDPTPASRHYPSSP
jgi:PleD family two-component response regulator